MPLPVITNVVRAALRGTCPSGSPWVNVLHFRKTVGTIDAASLNLLQTELVKLYGGPDYTAGFEYWMERSTTTTNLTELVFTPLDGSSASDLRVLNVVGISTLASLPSEVTACATLRTAVRGRRNRGRVYLPPFAISATDAIGNLGSTIASNLTAQGNAFRGALPALNWEWVVASYGRSGTITWTPYATPITAVAINTKMDVQRRRK